MQNIRKFGLLFMIAITLLATQSITAQTIHPNRLKINNARYGKSGQGMDVTNRVRSMVQNN
ncbi:MAG TPA: hypothetical protein VE779_05005, partial [Candidatus Angelobacter sp.]|nr:hypothetical protein [Candidatus Angelobacter sp.]